MNHLRRRCRNETKFCRQMSICNATKRFRTQCTVVEISVTDIVGELSLVSLKDTVLKNAWLKVQGLSIHVISGARDRAITSIYGSDSLPIGCSH